MSADPALNAAIGELADAILYGAAGIAVAILLMGAVLAVIFSEGVQQLRVIADHAGAIRDEGIDITVEPGAIGRPALDAEQIVRGAGFLITLLRGVVKKPGEAIPPADRLTLDLGKAMGVPLPVREEATAFLPNGTRVQSGLLPYGAASIPAALDPETV